MHSVTLIAPQSTVWWNVLMAFLHNRAAESHEILSVNVATNSDCVSVSLGLCSLFTWRRTPFDGIDEVSWNRRGNLE